MSDQEPLALVLSGGAARGAYEVGVIRYLREELPRLLGRQPQLDILSGSSVGAIHAAWLAATADEPETQGKLLAAAWGELDMAEILPFRFAGGARFAARALGTMTASEGKATTRPLFDDIVNTRPIQELIRDKIPWERISPNIDSGHVRALTVSAFDYLNTRTTVFVERADGESYPASADRRRIPVAAKIAPDHVLASAAMPLLFPPIWIGDSWFGDGGLRQNTPLSPALRLGAAKALVVSLKHRPKVKATAIGSHKRPPSNLSMAGRLLGALMLDPVEYDMQVLERINKLIEATGQDSTAAIAGAMHRARGAQYRQVKCLAISPSRDLGVMAGQFLVGLKQRPGLPRWGLRLLERVARVEPGGEVDLASYILFDGAFASQLIELGMQDSHARCEELVEFISSDR